MADKGNKERAGTEKKYTILKLTPVKYKISLHYLGEKYVKRHKDKYRCEYILKKDSGASLEEPPKCIPNVVRGTDGVDEDSKKAATPQEVVKNPTGDEVYRLLVTDNHTVPEVDANLLGKTGSPNGDTVSRPDYYRRANRKWMKDVWPAAPFRVIVRKFQGAEGAETQVDLEETVNVILEVKDPVEETDVHADKDPVKKCLRDFFKKYNRTETNPTKADDNSLVWFRGHRKPSDAKPGVKANEVIKGVPYVKPPTPDTVDTTGDKGLEYVQISTILGYKKMWVKLKPKVEKLADGGEELKIGIADFVFRPLPVGGDNYRFLIWLANDGGKDLRDTKINGVEVKLIDDDKKVIPKPRAYCTGRFVIWRKVNIRLLLLANGLAAGDINWNEIRGYYEHAFTEIEGPKDADKKTLPLAGWRQSLIDVFNGGVDTTNGFENMDNFRPAGKNPEDAEYENIYKQGLIPPFCQVGKGAIDVINLCNDILKKAVEALPATGPDNDLTKPRDRNIKGTGEGIYMLYAKENLGHWAGYSLGDGKLMVAQHTAPFPASYAGLQSKTTAHEMAHGFFLRHANTADLLSNVTYTPAASAAQTITVVNPRANCFPEDHDQHYCFKCMMSYYELEEFCGACALTLRFYDRVKVQHKDRFQNRLMEGFFQDDPDSAAITAKIVHADNSGGSWTLKETIPTVGHTAGANTLNLLALGPERKYDPGDGEKQGRVNLTCAHKNPNTLWSSSDTAILRVTTKDDWRAEVTGRSAGSAAVKYERNGKSVSANITVT